MNYLHVDSIRKSYGFNDILTDIFLKCQPGEIIGLIGRNGSGKSTFLKAVSAHISTENRYVKINGKVCQNLFDSRELLAYLPQVSFLPGHVRVERLIKTFLNHHDLIKISQIESVRINLGKRSAELSMGERRLIEIILIIFSSAPYILLDEPFNGLAPLQKDEIKTLIYEECQEKGVIITDHDYRNVLDLSTRQVLLRDGKLWEVKGMRDLQDFGYLPD